MKIKNFSLWALSLAALTFSSCSEDEIGQEPPKVDVNQSVQMTLEGKVNDGTKDGTYANMVYVDLSQKEQIKVARKSWHLGFYCGKDSHVTLNQSLSRAISTGKTDFAAVNEEDAKNAPNLAGGMMDFPKDKVITDGADRDLAKTVFGTIASDASKSEVFLVASADMKERSTWYKVKVTSTKKGYKVEYGNVKDQKANVVEINKDDNKLFIGFSLENGKVVDLPKNWDLMWSNAMAVTVMPNGKEILGPASDVIATNRYANVETAVVMVEDVCKYADFKVEDLKTIKYQKEGNVLGTSWRTAPMPNATPGPKADRFYVFKDAEGNYFKLRFLHFCEQDGGERGLPELEYELLK